MDAFHAASVELKARGAGGRLLPLMDHANPAVRLSAGLRCLQLDEPKAIATLEEVEKNGDFKQRDDARINLMVMRSKAAKPSDL